MNEAKHEALLWHHSCFPKTQWAEKYLDSCMYHVIGITF